MRCELKTKTQNLHDHDSLINTVGIFGDDANHGMHVPHLMRTATVQVEPLGTHILCSHHQILRFHTMPMSDKTLTSKNSSKRHRIFTPSMLGLLHSVLGSEPNVNQEWSQLKD
jgi:hypothetical protein